MSPAMNRGLSSALRSCTRCHGNVACGRALTGKRFASRSYGLPPNIRRHRALEVGGALAISLTALYLYSSQPVKLDSQAGLPNPAPPKDQSTGFGLIPYAEVQQHGSPEDCWVIIDGKIYDLTAFAEEGHPGGSGPIHQMAGRDATVIFKSIHPPGVIEHMLDPSTFKGNVDPATLPETVSKEASGEEKEREITLGEIIGLPDFDEAARRKLTAKAWAYMSAGATDMHSLDLNRSSFNSILFRPRILVDVDAVDSSTTMLGQPTALPIFLSPTGMAGLAHPDGEKLLTQAAAESDAIYMISTNASDPLPDIVNARSSRSQPLFMQLYVDRNRSKAEALIHKINDLGLKAIFVTVDCAAPGKREADERSMAEIAASQEIPGMSGGKISRDKKGGGIARAKGSFIDPTLNWSDIAWLRRHTNLPIGLKGVQCVEDCVKAVEMGVDAIYLSNHGGRALDGSAPALYTLLELRKHRPDVFKRCEVYIDGGVRRGTDVVKALCLGATGVGLGRPILYSMTYGKDGILHALDILRDEIHTTMRLLGVTRLDQLGPHLLNTKALDPLVADAKMLDP